ncbi:MAG TPA: HDOD domain-containing protein [Nitrospirae bacterium]|nr:HDOD domain-containing protein [Nitrospirota bacterium]
MVDTDTDRLIDLVEKMPGFSQTVTKIVALANDPNSTPADLVKTISMDPVLTAKLLKLINSAYFGLAHPIVSLQRAAIMLGFNTVKNIALSLSVTGTLKMDNNFKWFTGDQFWEHSLACAVTSKAIAKKAGVKTLDLEEYFIAGLLHDIGITLFVNAFTAESEEIYNPDFEPDKDIRELEKERFGMSHDELGGVMAEHWKLPESLVRAISGHHDPYSGPEEGLLLRQVIHISNHFCNERKISIHQGSNTDTIADEIWSDFRLSVEETTECFVDIDSTIETAKVFLKVAED